MSKWLLVILLLPIVVSAQLDTFDFPTPGSGGMVSNVDGGDVPPNTSLYMLNTDIVTRPGLIQKRLPLKSLQATTPILYGAYGYFHPFTGHKVAIGVTGHADYGGAGRFVVSDSFSYDLSDSLDALIFPWTDAAHDWTPWHNMLLHCDGKSTPVAFTTQQGYRLADSLPDTLTYEPRVISLGLEAPGQLRVGLMNFTDKELTGTYVYNYAFLIDTTGVQKSSDLGTPSVPVFPKNQRVILSMFEGFEPGDTTAEILVVRKKLDGQEKWYVIDTLGYKPAAFTVAVNGSEFRWPPAPDPYDAWVHECTVDVDLNQWIFNIVRQSYTSLGVQYNDYFATAEAIVDSMNTISGLKDSVRAYIARGGHFGSDFYLVVQNVSPTDTLGVRVDDSLTASRQSYGRGQQGLSVYIDSIADTTTVNEFDRTKIDTIYRRPGELLFLGDSLALPDDTSFSAYDDSVYALAYSFYDPVSGAESPVGPILWTKLVTFGDGSGGDGDTAYYYKFGIPQLSPDHPSWIRIYQGVRQSTLAGAGTLSDTAVLYGLYERRSGPFGSDSIVMVLGNWSDDAVALGIDTALVLIDTLYEYQMFTNANGDPVIVIPFAWNLAIPASDLAAVNNRLYAVGDPEFRNRISYSAPDSAWRWPPINVIRLDEAVNDEIVAIEPDLQETGLYVLKHNSIYLLGGYASFDPEYSFSYVVLSRKIGAVSKHTVVRYDGKTYFLSPDLKAYVLEGARAPREISQNIENWLDSLYSTYELALEHARVYALGDYILFGSDSSLEDNYNSATPLAFHPASETWSVRKLDSAYKPIGSFQYDTSSVKRGFGYYDWALFRDKTNAELRSENLSTILGDGGDYHFNFQWESPLLGSGYRRHQITEIQLTVNVQNRTWLRYTIYNAGHDSLVSDSIFLVPADRENQRITVLAHDDTQLSVRFWTHYGETVIGDPTPIAVPSWVEIKNVRIIMKDLGDAYPEHHGSP